MNSEQSNLPSLLPIRHPQKELFICDIADCVLKNDFASMEHPIFSLSKKPDIKERFYESGDTKLLVMPSIKGMATIYDKDILIYAISQLMAAKNAGRPISREVCLSARSFLIFSNRHTGGGDYEQLEAALTRLTGTRLKTTISTGGKKQDRWFGLVEEAETLRADDGFGRVQKLRIVLSDWLFNAINSNEVLSMHPDYFRLRKPLERRLYEIARKHCGMQKSWKISVEKLYRKSGSKSPMRQFQHLLRKKHEELTMPDYRLEYSEADQMVTFHRCPQHSSNYIKMRNGELFKSL